MRKPDDRSELRDWLNNPITEWYFNELKMQFDPHKRLLFSKADAQCGELKGEQNVMRFINKPEELL